MNNVDIHEDPSLREPLLSWRIRLLIGGLVVFLLCLAVPLLYFVFSSDRELREAIAAADRLDPGWRIPQLEEKRAVIPDEQNSALVIMAARSVLPADWPFWHFPRTADDQNRRKDEFQISEQVLWRLEPPVQLNERQTKALREELRRAGEALAAVRKVVSLPKGRCPIKYRKDFNYRKDFISTLIPFRGGLADLFAYDVLLRAQDKDVDGALTSCHAILNCGRSIGDEPSLFCMLVRDDLHWMVTRKVERTLAQGEPSEASLSSMQHDLEEEAEQSLLLIAARGERGEMDEALQTIQEGSLDPNDAYAMVLRAGSFDSGELLHIAGMYPPHWDTQAHRFVVGKGAKNIRAALLKHNNQYVEMAKFPVEQQVARIKELQAVKQDLSALARWHSNHVTNMAARFHRDQANLRCAVVMVAVERYRRAKDRWPDALTDLVPAYLAKVPLDPFDGAPLRSRRFDDGVVIYSVGPDGEDNGGKLDKNPTKEGTDLGFRLWDVAQRRRLPKSPDEAPKDQDE